MAVRHFKKKDYDVFFSSNYILTQHNAAGSPVSYTLSGNLYALVSMYTVAL